MALSSRDSKTEQGPVLFLHATLASFTRFFVRMSDHLCAVVKEVIFSLGGVGCGISRLFHTVTGMFKSSLKPDYGGFSKAKAVL